VPKGSGLIRVGNDTKAILLMNRKVRTLVDRKVKPRSIRWTASSRLHLKKGSKKTAQKERKIKVVKELRGFPCIPRSILADAATERKEKPAPAKVEAFRAPVKVTKSENLRKRSENVRKR